MLLPLREEGREALFKYLGVLGQPVLSADVAESTMASVLSDNGRCGSLPWMDVGVACVMRPLEVDKLILFALHLFGLLSRTLKMSCGRRLASTGTSPIPALGRGHTQAKHEFGKVKIHTPIQ